jgi:Protein of unknown function (DUF1552)
MSRLRLERRSFLRAVGATAATIPFLRALPGYGADPAGKRYLILLFTPNGVVRHLFGADPSTTVPGDMTLRPWLEPLKDYKQKMVIVDGLVNKAASGGTHGPGMATLWTGTGVAGDGSYGKGISIDQAIAAQLNAGTKYPSLEFRARSPQDYESKSEESRMIYTGPGAPKDPWENAATAANQLFVGLPAAGGMMSTAPPVDSRVEVRKRLFTHVDGELGRLAPKMCTEDRVQMDALRDGFHQLNSQLTTGGAAQAVASCSQPTFMGTKTLPVASRDMIELMAMSVACDLTRVLSFQFSAARSPAVFDWLGQTTDHHSISHDAPQPHELGPMAPVTSDPDHPRPDQLAAKAIPIKQMTDVNVWYATEIAYLVKRLSDFGVLDNCIICWGNELDNGSNHDHYDQNFVLIGGGSGKVKTNQLVTFKHADPYFNPHYGDPGLRCHNDLLVSLAQLMGVKIDKFGDAALNTGPITQLFAT